MPTAVAFARPALPASLVRHQDTLRSYLEAWLAEQECLVSEALASSSSDVARRCSCGLDMGVVNSSSLNSSEAPPDCFDSAPVSTTEPKAREAQSPKSSMGAMRNRVKSLATVGHMGTRAKSFLSKGTVERGMQAMGFRASKYDPRKSRMQEIEGLLDNWADQSRIVVCLNRVFRSPWFETLCQVVIMANTITLALSTEYDVDHPESTEHQVYDNFELAFTCFYTAEILLRIIVLRVQFLVGRDRGWNIFELILVMTSMQTQIGTGSSNLSYMRAMRLFKVMKVLRVVRLMRDFRELRLILDSLMGSLKSLLWSMLLILAINFMFGMCFVRAVTYAFIDPKVSDDAKASMREYWGGLSKSILSLYMATTGGMDWGDLSACLWDAGAVYYFIFCFYIGIFLFVIMNSLTSLFLDSVMQYQGVDEEEVIQEKLWRKAEYMSKLVTLFKELDGSGQGEITLDDFNQHRGDPRMEAFGASMEIETSDLERCFRVLTADGRRPVDMESFVVGCIRMKGSAKSIDMQGCLLSQRKSAEEQHRLASLVARQQQSLSDIERQLQSAQMSFAVGPAQPLAAPPTALVAQERSLRFSVKAGEPKGSFGTEDPGSTSEPYLRMDLPPIAEPNTELCIETSPTTQLQLPYYVFNGSNPRSDVDSCNYIQGPHGQIYPSLFHS